MSVKFGVFVPQGWKMDLTEIQDPVEQYEAMTEAGRKAEDLGYDSVWVYDHFHTVPEPTKNTVFECWTITAGLVRDLRRIKVGQMVTCNGYRNPSLLAKMASTVDVMSGGRLLFGLGAGWYEHEWLAYGYGFPETGQRIQSFREACEIVHGMWTEDDFTFNGKYYSVDAPINEPKGVRKPHPEFWIGGGGEKVTLKLVAKWGDACNISGDETVLRHKLGILKQHCDGLGRDYAEITNSNIVDVHVIDDGENPEEATRAARGDRSLEEYASGRVVGSAEEVTEKLRARADAGADYFIVYLPRVAYDHHQLELFARDVMPGFS
ncbi:LLM class F420-dependent oxidoreductase [Rubrobacter indicoceani]|uniref:LLM class F420-dependent oxidoreductase n=1 Tax=Rubrobacter indicoceani TaxID=2051957 RepID=UPI000E5AE7FB|nr:LLM class F420-dependent oxidoreductase [Rubrobacter indicoceani]